MCVYGRGMSRSERRFVWPRLGRSPRENWKSSDGKRPGSYQQGSIRNKAMNNDGKVWKGAAVLALGIAIAACGGGGGGSASGGNVSGGDDPGDGSDGGAGTLSGLTGDADN